MYFKFGLNTIGLSQSHFRNLSACSIIINVITNNAMTKLMMKKPEMEMIRIIIVKVSYIYINKLLLLSL